MLCSSSSVGSFWQDKGRKAFPSSIDRPSDRPMGQLFPPPPFPLSNAFAACMRVRSSPLRDLPPPCPFFLLRSLPPCPRHMISACASLGKRKEDRGRKGGKEGGNRVPLSMVAFALAAGRLVVVLAQLFLLLPPSSSPLFPSSAPGFEEERREREEEEVYRGSLFFSPYHHLPLSSLLSSPLSFLLCSPCLPPQSALVHDCVRGGNAGISPLLRIEVGSQEISIYSG